jgi:hypothetical protein
MTPDMHAVLEAVNRCHLDRDEFISLLFSNDVRCEFVVNHMSAYFPSGGIIRLMAFGAQPSKKSKSFWDDFFD